MARALEGLPQISERFREGKVSNSKVRADGSARFSGMVEWVSSVGSWEIAASVTLLAISGTGSCSLVRYVRFSGIMADRGLEPEAGGCVGVTGRGGAGQRSGSEGARGTLSGNDSGRVAFASFYNNQVAFKNILYIPANWGYDCPICCTHLYPKK